MQLGPISYRIADVEPDAELDGTVGRMRAIMGHYSFLHCQRTAHRPVDAVKYDKQRVAGSLDSSAAMLVDCRINHAAAEQPQSPERSHIIDADQAAVAGHIGVEYDDELSPR